MRLIDADALIEKHCEGCSEDIRNGCKTDPVCATLMWFEEAPTIDAVPVKRGTWKFNKDGSGTCDQCHFTQKAVWDFDRWQNFCGVCGADMRERKDRPAYSELKKADVVEVRRGKWVEADDGDGVVCSVCGEDFCTIIHETDRFKFCPNCGARMDGGT